MSAVEISTYTVAGFLSVMFGKQKQSYNRLECKAAYGVCWIYKGIDSGERLSRKGGVGLPERKV